jgi:molybdopterin synthase catalytic subunit
MPGAPTGRDWIALTAEVLPVEAALSFAGDPSCGAVALFLGIVRDESPGRPGVHLVEYEAWEEQTEPVLAGIVAAARARHPEIARVAVLHRTGPLQVGEASVLVCVSSPHRAAAFEAARFCIDTLKETAPIWKHEHWEGGHAFGLDAKPIAPVDAPATGDA